MHVAPSMPTFRASQALHMLRKALIPNVFEVACIQNNGYDMGIDHGDIRSRSIE